MLTDQIRDAEVESTAPDEPKGWQLLDRKLRLVQRHRAAIDFEELGYLVEAQTTHLYRRFGYVSLLEYMERVLAYGPYAAKERLAVAHEIPRFPKLSEKLRTGELCFSAVAALSKVVTAETESAWLERARGKTVRQVRHLVAGHKRGADPDDRPDPTRIRSKISADVSGETFALWRQTRVELEKEHGRALTDEEFFEVVCRRATAPASATSDARRAPVQRGIVTCRDCRRGWAVGAGIHAELTTAQLERALCDFDDVGDLESSVAKRITPLVPLAIRRKVFLRDKHGCVVPGCRAARYLDLHHIVPQGRGGGHQVWNLVALCSGHHQHHHDGRLEISGRAPHALEFRFRRPDGSEEVIRAAAQAADAAADPAETAVAA
ncbi:MAG: HNH endonuclease [Deltaproteobacteria bacterium]|nr:HNH endonuclease [Deltaproteobacteria bacterium]